MNLKISELLDKKWTNLIENHGSLEKNKCPGVYILAFTDKDLEGKSINIEDIFYVGMTNSLGGVKQRLSQFIQGIKKSRSHSAGMRFFKEYSMGKPFDSNQDKTFFVAFVSIPCKVNKSERTAEDLRKMGEVAKFEYDVLAYIKEKTGKEPELNKK